MNSRVDREFGAPNNTPVQSWEIRWLWGIIVFSWLVLLGSICYPVYRTDNVYFVVGAYSLASGHGFCDLSHPGAPLLTKYPPGQSLTMAAAIPLVGHGLKWLRLVTIVLQPLVLYLAFLVSRLRASPRLALAVAFLLAIHPVDVWGHLIMGNFALTASAFLLVLWLHEGYEGRHRAIWLGLALVLASYCHRSALTMAGISALWLAVRGLRREAVVVAGIVIVGMAPWCVRSYVETGYWLSREYQGEVNFRTRHCWDGNHCDNENVVRPAFFPVAALQYSWANTPLSLKAIGGGLFPWADTPLVKRLGPLAEPLTWLTWLVVSWFVFCGWLQELRGRSWREIPFTAIYLPWHLAMISIIVPGVQYHTYLLAPMYLYAGRGLLAHLPGSSKARYSTAAGLILVTAIVLMMRNKIYLRYAGIPNRDDRQPRWAWVPKVTPPGATVYWLHLSDYAAPQWRWFDTSRGAVGVPQPDPDLLKEPLVNYVGLESHDRFEEYLLEAGWQPIYSEGKMPPGTLPMTLWRRPARVAMTIPDKRHG